MVVIANKFKLPSDYYYCEVRSPGFSSTLSFICRQRNCQRDHLAMDEKDFQSSIFSTLSHGQVHRGCQMQFRYYIANFIKAIVFFNRKKNHGISQRPFEDQRIRVLVKPG